MTNSSTQPTFPRGFLPDPDPLLHLPSGCEAWDALGAELHKLVLSDALRERIEALPPLPLETLHSAAEQWRAASLLAYISSLYVLGSGGPPVARIPAVVAVPFYAVAAKLGIPPILSYALQAMHNWRRIDRHG